MRFAEFMVCRREVGRCVGVFRHLVLLALSVTDWCAVNLDYVRRLLLQSSVSNVFYLTKLRGIPELF